MRYTQLVHFYNWFAGYSESFRMPAKDEQENIALKIEHTYRVRDAIQSIGRPEGLNSSAMLLAETMALFHDVGRFEQYRRYRTFKDAASTNHAELGAEVLSRKRILECLPVRERKLILGAVALHNRPQLPLDLAPELHYFTRLLRDADKVDIFKVVTDYYDRKAEATNKTIELELSDAPEFTGKVLRDFMQGRVIYAGDMHTLNDFKLLQLAWVNDLNFSQSLKIIRRNHYLEKIMDTLPDNEQTAQVRQYIASVGAVPA